MPSSTLILLSSTKSFLLPTKPINNVNSYIEACLMFRLFTSVSLASIRCLWRIRGRWGRRREGRFARHGSRGAWWSGNVSRPPCPRCLVGFISQFLSLLSFIGMRPLMWVNGFFWTFLTCIALLLTFYPRLRFRIKLVLLLFFDCFLWALLDPLFMMALVYLRKNTLFIYPYSVFIVL